MSQIGQFQFAPFAPAVETLTGNTGGAVPPTGANINVVGTGSISVAGNSGTSTLTISNSGAVATSFAGDSGTAIPSSGVLTLHGGNNITTSATGSTVTFNVSGTTNNAVQVGNSSGSLTSLTVGTNGQVLIGSTSAAPAFASLTSTAGSLMYTTGAHSLNIDVTNYIPTTAWTPMLEFGGATTGITYTIQSGFYARNGSIVSFELQMVLSSAGSATGTATITGFPNLHKPASLAVGVGFAPINMAGTGFFSAYVDTSGVINLMIYNAGTSTLLTNSNFPNTANFLIAGSFAV